MNVVDRGKIPRKRNCQLCGWRRKTFQRDIKRVKAKIKHDEEKHDSLDLSQVSRLDLLFHFSYQ